MRFFDFVKKQCRSIWMPSDRSFGSFQKLMNTAICRVFVHETHFQAGRRAKYVLRETLGCFRLPDTGWAQEQETCFRLGSSLVQSELSGLNRSGHASNSAFLANYLAFQSRSQAAQVRAPFQPKLQSAT